MVKIIFDAHGRAGLAIARSLGRHKLPFISLGFKNGENTAFYSKFTKNKKEVIEPYKDPEKFVKQLCDIFYEGEFLLFPLGDKSDLAIIQYRDLVKDRAYFGYSFKSRKDTMNKLKTLRFAKKLRLNTPITFEFFDAKNFFSIKKDLGLPFVIKPIQNFIFSERENIIKALGSTRVIFNEKDFNFFLKKNSEDLDNFLIQQYIPGIGYGFSTVTNTYGKFLASFMHKRIHETEGFFGVSSLAKSFYDSYLEKTSLKLLKKMKFKGVAMVEYRKSYQNDKYFFMEINSRYWGTLSLAISSGIDFPYLHAIKWNDPKVKYTNDYFRGKYWRFLVFGELRWLKSILDTKNKKIPFYSQKSYSEALYEFFQLFFKKNVCYSIESIDDPLPSLYTYYTFLKNILRRR